MADNVEITAGTGTVIATDQLAGNQHAQLVKLLDGTADSAAVIPGDATNGLDVDVTRVQGIVAAGGDVAHDGADSGNPLKIGLKAIAHGANPTQVAAADRSNWYCNRHGIPFVVGGHPNTLTLRLNFTAVQSNVAIITVAAGTKIVVTQIQVTASNANTVSPSVLIGFGTATTPTTTGVVLAHPGVPPGGGCSRGDGSGIIGVGADDEDLRITASVPTGGSCDVVVSYFTIES